MLSNINPVMLILARESRGFSQSDLADKIGVSQGKLSKAEKGEQSLPRDALKNICLILNYPENFFFQESPNAPISHYYYRKKVDIAQKVMVQLDASIKIFRKNIDVLIDAVELPEFKIPTFSSDDDDPSEVARKVRYLLNVPSGPISNLTNLLENNGIIIVKTDLFNEKTDALSTISDKGVHIIFMNSRMPNDRQRFSLAHEFGHLLMHFDMPSTFSNVEDEANIFASEFLMPASEISSSLRINALSNSISKLADLKRYWKVSMKALVHRAKFLNCINHDQYRNFQFYFSKNKMNKNEPIPIAEERPYILNEIIKLHNEELGYNKNELSRILFLNPQELEERFLFHDKPKLKILRQLV